MARRELIWSRNNPEGRVEEWGENGWILWNFDVGSALLKPEHVEALDEILSRWRAIKQFDANAYVIVQAHASETGSDQTNLRISKQRLEAIKAYFDVCQEPETPRVNGEFYSRGESGPWMMFAALSGEALAKNRRVEINIQYTPRPAAKEPEPEEVPEREKEVPERQQVDDGTLTQLGVEGMWSYRYEGVPIYWARYIIIYPEVKFQFSLALPGSGIDATVEYVRRNGWAIKATLKELFDLNGEPGDLQISLTKDELALKTSWYEGRARVGPAYNSAKGPLLVFEFAEKPFNPPEFPLFGRTIKLNGAVRVTVKIGASPALLKWAAGGIKRVGMAAKTGAVRAGMAAKTGAVRLGTWAVTTPAGTAATAIGSGIAGTAALLLGLSILISRGRAEARRQIIMDFTIRGFALRIAAEGASNENYVWARDELEALYEEGKQEAKAAYDGWVAAGLMLISVSDREGFFGAIRSKFGTDVREIYPNITQELGPRTNWAPDAIPKTLEELLSL